MFINSEFLTHTRGDIDCTEVKKMDKNQEKKEARVSHAPIPSLFPLFPKSSLMKINAWFDSSEIVFEDIKWCCFLYPENLAPEYVKQ